MIKKNINASVIFHAIKFSETFKKKAEKLLQKEGLTTQQWFILLLLAKDPNLIYLQENKHEKDMMAMELADALNVSRANITKLLSVLLEKKLILQYEDKTDKRRKRLKLTSQGEKTLFRFEDTRNSYNSKLFTKFTKDEKEGYIAFVKKCLSAMKANKNS
jgi:DNA-binding MarR family transcriptional regulator